MFTNKILKSVFRPTTKITKNERVKGKTKHLQFLCHEHVFLATWDENIWGEIEILFLTTLTCFLNDFKSNIPTNALTLKLGFGRYVQISEYPYNIQS